MVLVCPAHQTSLADRPCHLKAQEMETYHDHHERIFDCVDAGRDDLDLKEWRIRYHNH